MDSPSPNPTPVFSVVVPFFNEADNLPPLIKELDEMLHALDAPAEIILVNDGSTDTYERPERSPQFPVRWLDLSENSGQSAAMYFGMQAARGKFIILLDADLQNDPFDVPKLYDRLRKENLDLITGIRIARQDNWVRRASSRLANRVRSFLLKDNTTDTGCTLKVVRAEAAKRLPAWNGMHRFIPALVKSSGFKIGEAPVSHRARHAGESKVIGRKRAVRATTDLLGMLWLSSRQFHGRLKPAPGQEEDAPATNPDKPAEEKKPASGGSRPDLEKETSTAG
ncbi:MAG: glycosyltransferase family 2 protein [Verrucomicrobiota bacterium]